MSQITKESNFSLRLEKSLWTESDIFLAKCLDISFDNGVMIADLRIVPKKALFVFLSHSYRRIMTHPDTLAYRNSLFKGVKEMYESIYDDFIRVYYPKMGYVKAVGRDVYDHQKKVLSQIIHRQFNLLALDMGTGKTLTAATLSKIVKCRRTVIVCPSVVKWNWMEDMTENWGYNPIHWTIIDAKKSKSIFAFDERFIILNYEQVGKNMNYLLSDEIGHLVLDEAHYLKNYNSGRSQDVRELIEKSKCARLTMLTGTPVTNRIVDMFNYLKMANHPLGINFAKFKHDYALMAGRSKVVGAKNIPDLKNKISSFMIRIRSEDCLDLPEMTIKNYYIDPEDLSKDYEIELQNLRDKKEKFETLHGKEKQQMRTQIKNNIHTLNRIVATSKVKKVLEFIDYLNESGEKVVVFSGYRDPLLIMEAKLGDRCVKVDGSVDSHKRSKNIKRFIKDPKCTVFIGNTKAAGIGINLVNARHVIFLNFPFTPDQIEQAQKRLHRGGQKRKVMVYYTIAKGTIDSHIYSLIIDKSSDINDLVDGDHESVIRYGDIESELFNKLLEK